jgi:hypothetical protein
MFISNTNAIDPYRLPDMGRPGDFRVTDEWSRLPAVRVERRLVSTQLEIGCNRIEQLIAGCELKLTPANEVLETPGQRIGFRIAAHLQYVSTSARVFGFTLESHSHAVRIQVGDSVSASDRGVVSERSLFGLNRGARLLQTREWQMAVSRV